ncbi:MAG TPA: PA14 domain-containing protein [Anaerolineae bacterium]|nr:PA14 domain-containing protein [Anaerolineae bacterium]HPL29156.1 PA14 domain-containing protein [Anaerolineae bacterium]
MIGFRSCRAASRLLLALVLIALVVPPLAVSAATPAFRGEYYNNRDLSGAPVLVRDDAAVNFNWGNGSPGSPVNADNFAVRWTNFVSFEAGTYRFTVRVDDGARLWIDDALVLDRWVAQPATTFTVDRSLGAGYHHIRMEYFEATGEAVAQLSWEKLADTSFPQWKAEYYGNTDLSGSPLLVRNDADINFHWGYGSPASQVPADSFSVRWTRSVSVATAGTYTFTATADDGIRVKVDGTMLIDRWVDQSATTFTGSVYLGAGAHTVVVEYYERTGVALARVSWAASATPQTVTVTVDDLDSGFTRGGNLESFHPVAFGYRSHLFYVWNNTSTVYNWGRWTPKLPGAGNYEVQVYIPSRYFGTTSARYRISHNGATNDRVVSQARYYDQWVSLGSYYFSGKGQEYVYLGSATGEPWATRTVGFDAVRFIGTGISKPAEPLPPCSIMPVQGFGNAWNGNAALRASLGCPTDVEKAVWLGEQTFQFGTMFWRGDTGVIYVLFNDGTWVQFGDTWNASQPEVDSGIHAPSGLFQPKRGFGKAWRDHSDVRSRVGWGLIEERGVNGAVQPFERGLMLWSPRLGIYSLSNDGRWQHF